MRPKNTRLNFRLGIVLVLNIFLFNQQISHAAYCVPLHPACGNVNNIQAVSIAGTSFSNVSNSCSNTNGNAYTIYSVSPTTTATLTAGSSYNFSVTSNNNVSISLWIDFNQNQVFEANEWKQVSASSTPNIASTVSVLIPATATQGLTGMRVRTRTVGSPNGSGDACLEFFSGETEDYSLTIGSNAACSSPPAAGTTTTSVNPVCSGTSVNLILSGSALGTGLSYQWQASSDSLVWTVLSGATLATYSYTANLSAYYRCAVTCNGSTYFSIPLKVNVLSGLCYCASSASSAGSADIGRVVIGNRSNGIAYPESFNPAATNTYSDFRNLTPADMEQGSSVPVAVTQISSGVIQNAQILVYVDWNKDGIFTYPNEYTYIGQTSDSPSGTRALNNVIVPINASLGTTTMRVILTEFGVANQPACGNYSYGETEDYTVNVTSQIPCGATLSGGIAESSSPAICGNKSFMLNLKDGAAIYNSAFYWESSVDSINWTTLPGSNGMLVFTTTQSQATYYRCVTNCGFNVAYSTVLYLPMTSLDNCYCNSASSGTITSNIGNVSFANLSNGIATPVLSNPSTPQNYSFFNNLSIPQIEAGSTTQISVSQISFSGTFYTGFVYAYIDFNRDGYFAGSETFSLGATTPFNGGNTISSSFLTPFAAQPGITRLRIVLSEDVISPACGVYAHSGETEDYLIEIIPYIPCSGTPTGGTTLANLTAVCPNSPVSLSLTGNTNTGGVSYQWQYSVDSVFWNYFFNGTYSTYTATQIDPTYYRCEITCNFQSSYSTPVFVDMSPGTQCYCASSALSTADTDIGNVSIGTLSNGSSQPVLSNIDAFHTYSDFTQLPPTNLEAGGGYNMTISQITSTTNFYTAYASVFIDFNQDGIFDGSESFFANSPSFYPSNTTINAFIQIPANAMLGNTRMRVILSEAAAQTQACGNYNYGETEDYTINIIPPTPCPSTILGGTTISTLPSVCSFQNFDLSLSGNTSIPSITYQWQSSNDTINWVDIFGANNSFIQSTFQSASTYYRCKLSCSGQLSFSTTLFVPMSSLSACYCPSYAAISTQADIGNVTFAGINNGSAVPAVSNPTATNTYTDFTSIQPANLERGGSYPIQITQISSTSTNASSSVNAFIDFNQNAIFESFESFNLGVTSASAGGNIINGLIPVPSTANLGLTRLRIVLIQNSTTQMACSVYNYGETEDYLVNIINPAPCSLPNGGNAVAADSSLCSGSIINLNLSNSSQGSNIVKQWENSVDGINWTAITGANTTNYSAFFTQTIYYRCKLSCDTFVAYSSVVMIVQNPASACYCVSSAVQTADDDIGNVTIGTLNNGISTPALNNANSNKTYTDFTSLPPVPLAKGMSYPISVTQINSGGFYACKIMVYLDFNNNGVFEATGESWDLGFTSNGTGGNVRTGSIAIPVTAVSGTIVMRIVLQEGLGATAPACGTYNWGETEDYRVLLYDLQSCTSAPTGGQAIVNQNNSCANTPFTLSVTGNTSALGQTFRWQASTDSINWTYISPLSNDSNFTTTQNIERYYRCELNCGSLQGYSLPVFVTLSQATICGYCSNVGGTLCPASNKITNVTIFSTNLNNSDTACYNASGNAIGVFSASGASTATLIVGNSYLISVTANANVGKSLWIDFNQDGVFDSNEYFAISTSSTPGIANYSSFTIPWGSSTGLTGLRIRTRNSGSPITGSDACTYFTSGETEQYTVFIDVVNSSNSFIAQQGISIYPNPAKDDVTIASDLSQGNYRIKNMLGELVMSDKLSDKLTKLNLANLAKGVYLIEVQTKTSLVQQKLVKE